MDSPAKTSFIVRKARNANAFTLVEVVLALGICSFVLVALIGLFQVGLSSGQESEKKVLAANLASHILAIRLAAPLVDKPDSPIPSSSLTLPYAEVYTGKYVAIDGNLTTDLARAVCRVSCSAGQTPQTGSRVAQVRLELSWPPQSAPSNSTGRYEILSFIPLN